MNSMHTRAPHPGRYIEEERVHLNITAQALAESLGISLPVLNQLINGLILLTPEIAIRLSNIIGSTPEMWGYADRILNKPAASTGAVRRNLLKNAKRF